MADDDTQTQTPPVTKVTITAGGASVTIEAPEPMAAVTAVALETFAAATGGAGERLGPAYGFTAERRDAPPAQASGMRWAPGPYPVQSP